ncbi:MAG: EAL domain-containing protein [Actinomycetota bacterium]
MARPERRGRYRFQAVTRPVVELGADSLGGLDVMVRNPPLLTDGAPGLGGDVDVPARLVLDRVEASDDIPVANAALVHAALRTVESAPSATDRAPFVAIALHAGFIDDGAFLDTVKSAVRRSGVDPHRLLLSVKPDPDLDRVWPSLQRLRSHGVRVALEIAGTDAESVALLHRHSFDVVRVPAVVAVDAVGAASAGVVRLVAVERGQVWIEDVATPDEMTALAAAGCRFASGPVPPEPDATIERRPV